MIKAILTAAVLFTASLSAHAQTEDTPITKFVCGNVGGAQEWSINIDLDRARAYFMDEGRGYLAFMREVHSTTTKPTEWIYNFEGREANGPFRIEFNETKLEAKLTLNIGTPNESILKAQNGCKKLEE